MHRRLAVLARHWRCHEPRRYAWPLPFLDQEKPTCLLNRPTYDAENDRWLDVGAAIEVRSGVLRDKLDLLERRYRDRLAD